MTLDLDDMTQAEFDEVMAEIKEKRPNLFQAPNLSEKTNRR